jgi:TFIIF-interacting CTD phosphatase-like protein
MKPNIILDLDQTLIDAKSTDEYKTDKKKEEEYEHTNMDDIFIVFHRPHLQEFLDYLFENFNVSVWTAASKDYALFIIEKIILRGIDKRQLDYIFFIYHGEVSRKLTNNTKNLSMLYNQFKLTNYNKNNTLIIDDYDEVYNTQPQNCIRVSEFFIENKKKDTQLLDLIPKLKDIKKRIENNENIFI